MQTCESFESGGRARCATMVHVHTDTSSTRVDRLEIPVLTGKNRLSSRQRACGSRSLQREPRPTSGSWCTSPALSGMQLARFMDHPRLMPSSCALRTGKSRSSCGLARVTARTASVNEANADCHGRASLLSCLPPVGEHSLVRDSWCMTPPDAAGASVKADIHVMVVRNPSGALRRIGTVRCLLVEPGNFAERGGFVSLKPRAARRVGRDFVPQPRRGGSERNE